ncbi:MAG: hypothetical protein KIT58_09510 [Planctomycetota bacterium]|nr:hypothetical protein [Planctomycetota bacterium]
MSGSRYFVTNHAGVIYYSTRRPFEVDPSTCAIPPHGVVLGKAEPAEEPQRGR